MSSDAAQEQPAQQVQQAPATGPGIAPPQKPKVSMLDRVTKFINMLEPILRIAHVIVKGIKEALNDYRIEKAQEGQVEPPAPPQVIVQNLGPQSPQ